MKKILFLLLALQSLAPLLQAKSTAWEREQAALAYLQSLDGQSSKAEPTNKAEPTKPALVKVEIEKVEVPDGLTGEEKVLLGALGIGALVCIGGVVSMVAAPVSERVKALRLAEIRKIILKLPRPLLPTPQPWYESGLQQVKEFVRGDSFVPGVLFAIILAVIMKSLHVEAGLKAKLAAALSNKGAKEAGDKGAVGWQSRQLGRLQAQVATLTSDKSTLTAKVTTLVGRTDSLRADKSSLVEQKGRLELMVVALGLKLEELVNSSTGQNGVAAGRAFATALYLARPFLTHRQIAKVFNGLLPRNLFGDLATGLVSSMQGALEDRDSKNLENYVNGVVVPKMMNNPTARRVFPGGISQFWTGFLEMVKEKIK